jgi:copper homeostasis protein
MLIEVIAYTVRDALNVQSGGADRIELVSGMMEGGLTPSYGLIKEVINAVSIPVHVMVRPHSLSFCYDEYDIKTMIHEIKMIKQLGASGVVFGTVRDSEIDVKSLEKLLSHVDGLNVTYHRAFDDVYDQETTVKILLEYPQIRRILTSGKKKNAFDAIQQIRNLIKLTEGTHLAILPGSGLKYVGIREFVDQTGATELHFGQGVRVNGILSAISPCKIAEIKKELSNGPSN